MKPDAPTGEFPGRSLDALLRRYAAGPVPPVPGDLESRVRREIRLRQTRGRSLENRLARWLWPWHEPRVAFAGVAAAALIGVGMSWTAPAGGRGAGTRQALDLGVFSADAPALPSTRLLSPVSPKE